ncbi:hypothetical protein FACS1894199_06720 [Bacteroidia bacterium]|nr:hypothetical protein FACS1894199_06720 [Bacteroidia bacterium]
MKKVLILVATATVAGVMMTACGGSKKLSSTDGSTEVTVPLSGKEYRSDKDYFRATQTGKSPDLATAKKIALQNAKAELAGNIQSTVKAVTENYTNQRSVGDKQEFENKFEENARTVVNQSLNDVKIIGEKTFKEKDGKLTYYIAIEMSKEPIVNNIADRISKDAKLQLDFDKHQFQKTFDEEMKKFENQ